MATNRIALHLVNLSVRNDIIPAGWYKERHRLKSLCIRNGNITAIESNAFNTKAFEHLHYLEIDGIAVKCFKSGMFNGLVSLKILILRNLNLNKCQWDFRLPAQNPAWNDINQVNDLYRLQSSMKRNCSYSRNFNHIKQFNIATTCFEIFYLNENYQPVSPWTVFKKLKVILTTLLASSLFSFYLGFRLSFSIFNTFRKITRKLKEFRNQFINDAAAKYISNESIEDPIRFPIKKRTTSSFYWLAFLFEFWWKIRGVPFWFGCEYLRIYSKYAFIFYFLYST